MYPTRSTRRHVYRAQEPKSRNLRDEREKADDEENYLKRRNVDNQLHTELNCLKFIKIKPFPSNIPTSQKWENWIDYRRKLNIQFEQCAELSEKFKAGLLFTNIGEETEKIITTRGMFPEEEEVGADFPFFKNLTSKLESYFKSLADETVNINTFATMKQLPNEGARDFETRLLRQADVCELKGAEAMIRNQFIQGMRDREHAKRAFTDGAPLEVIVAAASRTEAYALKNPVAEPLFGWSDNQRPLEVAAISQRATRSNHNEQNPRQGSRSVSTRQQGWRSGSSRQGQNDDDKRCRNCGIRSHKYGVCPAINKTCRKCDKIGHFAVMCRSTGDTVANLTKEEEFAKEDKVTTYE